MRCCALTRSLWVFLLSLCAACAIPAPLPTTGSPAATVTFEPDPTPHPNPDRGFAADSSYPDEPVLDAWGKIAQAEAQGIHIRLIRRTYYLHAYASQETLPPSLLATVAQDLSAAREAGVRLILRFAYRPEENSETVAYCDPPLERVLSHLAQLGPILRAGRGAIAYLEAGLIGPWGEWHSASPEAALLDPLPGYSEGPQPPCGRANYDRKLPNYKTLQIVEALLNEVPGRRVAVRHPMAKAKLLELAAGGEEGSYPSLFEPLTAAEAHRDTLKARLGGHNDCFLASPDDNGTYFYTPGPQQEREKEYWSQDNRYTVMGGETCTPAPYIPAGEDPAAYVYAQFRRFRFNNLNLHYHPGFIGWLAAQPFGDGTLLEALERDLGYRLHLRRATLLPERAPAGSALQVTLELENLGFGSLYNPKTLTLVFRGEDGTRVERVLEEAFYGPAPEEGPAVYTYTVSAPTEAGRYDLYLKISDPDVPEDIRYHVRLATRTAYEEGMHALNLALEVVGSRIFLPFILRDLHGP
ncbi:DUF4832 domain-containing protein [Thermoflexus hugenholtzii]|uniref:DUF4832 domain-containing protein n=1 Tax=Thermoflexus hugenholtzii JAD2 TaxID=877466 RepID=A0A212RQL9_9CHLR|nr:DUF4832 domain-containing protein [Thermoflexus hugenholtzii]SNB74772.1 protein of unknown function [Thermoflexus hugenholtzii JAD2]